MKNVLFLGFLLAVLWATWTCTDCPTSSRFLAQTSPATAPATIKGDLVIDFLGGVRGYVEPCG